MDIASSECVHVVHDTGNKSHRLNLHRGSVVLKFILRLGKSLNSLTSSAGHPLMNIAVVFPIVNHSTPSEY